MAILTKKSRSGSKTNPNSNHLTNLLKVLLVLTACKVLLVQFNDTETARQILRAAGSAAVDKSSDDPRVVVSEPPIRPFHMPVSGAKWSLFQPEYDMDKSEMGPRLYAPTEDFLDTFATRIRWLDQIVKVGQPVKDRAQELYLEMMKSTVSATVYNKAEKSIKPAHSLQAPVPISIQKREGGEDWAYFGDTMTGWKRLDNVWNLIKSVVEENVPGDYIETGVWRGGSSVFARAVLNAYGQSDRRSFLCDSFAGLPPGDRDLDKKDKNWDVMHWYLAVPEVIVASNFRKYGLLDHNVVFAKGFFNETMPELKKHAERFSVMRLDGDMYESTVDVLYNLYDKLSIGGYVIMDDWFGFPSKTACEDFFRVHGIQPEIIPIDNFSAYWKKTEEVEIQFWRYEQNNFK